MKNGDPIQIRVANGEWLDGIVLMVCTAEHLKGRPAVVAVDEGIPFPFGLLGEKQAVFVHWDRDIPTDLHNPARRIELRCPPA